MTKKLAKSALDEIRGDNQFFYMEGRRMWTAQELLEIVSGNPVTYDETIEYLVSLAKA